MSSSANSWGRAARYPQTLVPLRSGDDAIEQCRIRSFVLPYGRGRSYGDSCLNDEGALLSTHALRQILSFDSKTGVIRCESGATFEEILNLCVPHGFFIPITLGTKAITVGGAVANDIHGKNHHVAGTFGCHVRAFELLRSDGTRTICSSSENEGLFRATIGGLGLTGLILWVEFQLERIPGPTVLSETIPFFSLDEFFERSQDVERNSHHVAAWVNGFQGKGSVQGFLLSGNFTADGSKAQSWRPNVSVAVLPPVRLIPRPAIKLFNRFYASRMRSSVGRRLVSYDSFFFPLDSLRHWNRLYGPKGFFQYQCVLPKENARKGAAEIFDRCARPGDESFLVVLKHFGDLPSPGLLSFPRPGLTICLDFPNEGERTLRLMDDLDAIVSVAGGAVYPAKDARMSPEMFRASFPRWREFAKCIDPKFSSNFWRRVNRTPSASERHPK